MVGRIILFLLINFGALGLGSLWTGKGVPSEWYQNLAKAPWTPPGWVFGAAWTTIMICFSVYMAQAWSNVKDTRMLVILFSIQWVLNVSWNPLFFHLHLTSFSLLVISALTLLMTFFLWRYWTDLHWVSLLVLPYVVWLFIATSLNAFIVVQN